MANHKRKYDVGDYVGPNHDILILERSVGGNPKRIRLKCPVCGSEQWIVDLSSIHKGVKRCYECYKKERIIQFHNNTKYSSGDLVGPFDIEFIQYTETGFHIHSKGLFKCPIDGYPFEARIEYVQNGAIRTCSEHSKISSGEAIVKKFLDKHNIKYYQQHIFSDCINPKTKYPLRFDFYLFELGICIEYNGLQHYQASSFFGGEEGFTSLQYRDNIKLNYCLQHKIKMIYFKYNQTEEEIENQIISLLQERT